MFLHWVDVLLKKNLPGYEYLILNIFRPKRLVPKTILWLQSLAPKTVLWLQSFFLRIRILRSVDDFTIFLGVKMLHFIFDHFRKVKKWLGTLVGFFSRKSLLGFLGWDLSRKGLLGFLGGNFPRKSD